VKRPVRPPRPAVKRAAIYVRVSSEEQVGNTSLDDQEARCRRELEHRGWALAGVYREEGVSGTKDSRPQFDQLLAACRAREVDVVLATKVDRLARRSWIFGKLVEDLEELGASVVVLEANIDTTTPAGRAMREILGTFAALDRDSTVEKMARGQHASAALNRWPCSMTPYGYRHATPKDDTHLVIDEEQARLIRAATDWLVDERLSTGEAARRLNALGWLPPKGGLWTHQNLRRKLSSRGLVGQFIWADVERGIASGKYGDSVQVRADPILTESRWRALQSALGRRAYGYKRPSKPYPLTGRLVCSCGQPHGGVWRGDRDLRQYRCRGSKWSAAGQTCNARRINADWVERLVWEQVCGLLAEPGRLLACVGDYAGIRQGELGAQTDNWGEVQARVTRLERALTRATKATLLADEPGVEQELAEQFRAELADARRMEAQLRGWRESSTAEVQRVADLQALAEHAARRLPAMSLQERAEVLALLDVRVTVLDDPPAVPRRGGVNGGAGPWRPQLRIEGSVPHAKLLDTLTEAGDPEAHKRPPDGPPRPGCGPAAFAALP